MAAINAATMLIVRGLRAATAAAGLGPVSTGLLTNLLTNVKVSRSLLPSMDTWWILNTDTGETVHGQYTTEVTSGVSATYAENFALNRQTPVTQFLHGNTETLTFQGRFYASFVFQEVTKQSKKLQQWTRRDPLLGRPPVCYFWIGNQYAEMQSCYLQAVNIKYDRATKLGQPRGATVSVNLRAYTPYSLNDVASFDTRYHLAKPGDSFEKLAAREYANPMLGIQLRQNHPELRHITPGDIIKLPAATG